MSVERTGRRRKRHPKDRSSGGKVQVFTESIFPALVSSGVVILCFYQDTQIGIGALMISPILFLLVRSVFEGLSTAIKVIGRERRGEKGRRLRRSSGKFSSAKALVFAYNLLPALVTLRLLITLLRYGLMVRIAALIVSPILFLLVRSVFEGLGTAIRVIVVRLIRVIGQKSQGEKAGQERRRRRKR